MEKYDASRSLTRISLWEGSLRGGSASPRRLTPEETRGNKSSDNKVNTDTKRMAVQIIINK